MEVSKEDIELAKKKEAQQKKQAEALKKQKAKEKEQAKKEKELEKALDPELKLALENDKFTEDMLSMLLKPDKEKDNE